MKNFTSTKKYFASPLCYNKLTVLISLRLTQHTDHVCKHFRTHKEHHGER